MLDLLRAGEPTPMLHLNSHHNAFAHKQLLCFSIQGEVVVCFPFFFFFFYEFQIPKPTQGKDDTL